VRIVSAFVHNGQPADIEAVMVDGRWLMRDRKVLTLDEKNIVTRAEAIGQRAWRQLVEKYPDVSFPIRLPSGGGAGTVGARCWPAAPRRRSRRRWRRHRSPRRHEGWAARCASSPSAICTRRTRS